MDFRSAARPCLANGRPTWLSSQHVALPGIMLTPAEEADLWEVELLLDGSWATVELPLRGVMTLLLEWSNDPEAALMNYWGREPPERQVVEVLEPRKVTEVILTTVSSPEDLDL